MNNIKVFLGTKVLLPFLAAFIPIFNYAQLKISSVSEIENKAKEGADTIVNIAKYVMGAILAIGAIGLIYAMVTDNPKKREFLVGYIVAVILILIIWSII